MPVMILAQTQLLGTWNVINAKYILSNKLNIFSEAQLRSLKTYDHFHYHEIKAGINYELTKGLKVATCVGKYDTYKEGGNFVLPKNTDEIRWWQQATLDQTLHDLRIEQRYRMESRFTTAGFRIRYRYRVGLSYEFGKPVKHNKPFILSLSNEVFFGTLEPYFERNRIQAALTYKLNKKLAFQAGYIHQFDYKINDETGKDFLQLGIYVEISRVSRESDNIKGDVKVD